MSRIWEEICCPEFAGHIILAQRNSFFRGGIRLKCRMCRQFFIVDDAGNARRDESIPAMNRTYYERVMTEKPHVAKIKDSEP
jgi:hypothetical protein